MACDPSLPGSWQNFELLPPKRQKKNNNNWGQGHKSKSNSHKQKLNETPQREELKQSLDNKPKNISALWGFKFFFLKLQNIWFVSS